MTEECIPPSPLPIVAPPMPAGVLARATHAAAYGLKAVAECLPEPLARPLVWVPYSLRLGGEYARSAAALRRPAEQRGVIEARQLARFREVLNHAVEHVPFYRQHYRRHGFAPGEVRTLADITRVPIVTRADLQDAPLELRCDPARAGRLVRTGGTTGQPLAFRLDRTSVAVEWAHMHHMWRSRGYRPGDLNLGLRGWRGREGRALRFNPVHNEYAIAAGLAPEQAVAAVLRLSERRPIRWIHGFPSLVAEFADALSRTEGRVAERFRRGLRGVLLCSEAPLPAYRARIRRALGYNILSWYGHSEMAVLAQEGSEGVYRAFPTYGLAEAVPDDRGHRLVGTSFHNRVHPFIRYDTGDRVTPMAGDDGAFRFGVDDGRMADFVMDRGGRALALTSILFGRTHAALAEARHVQVRDDGAGRITLLVTPGSAGCHDAGVLRAGFDFEDLAIDVAVEVVAHPVRTPAGKIQLKIGSGNGRT